MEEKYFPKNGILNLIDIKFLQFVEDVSYYWKSILILILLLYLWLAFLILEVLFSRLRKSTDLTSNFWKASPWNPNFAGISVPCVIKSKQLQCFEFWIANLWILPAIYIKTFFTESLTQCWTLITFIDFFLSHWTQSQAQNKQG